MFLNLLDDYWYDGWSLRDVIGAMGDKVSRALQEDANLAPGRQRPTLAVAIEGFAQYLLYAEDLRDLLLRTENSVLGSLIWLFHSYFYGQSAESARDTIQAVRLALAGWSSGEDQGMLAMEQASLMVKLFDDLTDSERWLRTIRYGPLSPYLASLDLSRPQAGA